MAAALFLLAASHSVAAVATSRWHTTELTFTDTAASYVETLDVPNPFKDLRLTCTFTAPGASSSYVVQGFFAGDGAGGAAGSTFACRFSFPAEGAWSYVAKLCAGSDVALDPDPSSCPSNKTAQLAEPATGEVIVGPSPAVAPDFRAPERGWVRNPSPGGHALVFAGGGGAFVKAGLNLGDGFLGYRGFDNTAQQCTPDISTSVKTYAAHAADWQAGDPDWACVGCTHPDPQHAGREIVGAMNYIAGGFNSKFMMVHNTPDGDTCDVYPYVDPDDKLNFDVSKLEQWEIFFEHAQRRGVCLHLAFGEREITNELDGGALGTERKLFYREMVARFGHHPCVEWNLGEEQTYWKTPGRIDQFADYLKRLDPYDHPLAANTNVTDTAITGTHTEAKLAGDGIDLTSIQGTWEGYPRVWNVVQRWRTESVANGFPWVVAVDETKGLSISPTDPLNPITEGRTQRMWPWLLSGGLGFEWYLLTPENTHELDPRIDDFHVVAGPREWTRHANAAFAEVDASAMSPFPPQGAGAIASASGGPNTWTLAERGHAYVLYNAGGGSFTLDLADLDSIGKAFDVTFVDAIDGSRCAGPRVVGGSAATVLGACSCGGAAACSADVAVLVTEVVPGASSTTVTTIPPTTSTTATTTTTLVAPTTSTIFGSTTTLVAPTTSVPVTSTVEPATSSTIDATTTTLAGTTTTTVASITTLAPTTTTTLPPSTTTTVVPTTTTLAPTTTTLPPPDVAIESSSIRTACGSAASDTLTIANVPVTARPNRVLVVTVGAEEDNGDCDLAHAQTVVTYGGRPMARAVTALSGTSSWRACNGIFYLLDPPTGTANVSVTFPATTGTPIDNRHAGAILLYNVAQAPPQAIAAGGADASTNPVTGSVTANSAGALALDVITQGNTGSFAPLASGQVERWDVSCGSSSSATSTKEIGAPASTAFTWSHSDPRRYAHARAVFAAAGVPLTTTTTTAPPPECVVNADCSDADQCTTDACVAGACVHTPACSGGEVTVDTASVRSVCAGTAGDTLVIPNVPVGAGAGRVLVVTVGAETEDADCNLAHAGATVSYSGRALTRAVAALSDTSGWRTCNAIFYLLDPPTGTANVAITFPATIAGAVPERHAGAFVLHGAAQTAPQATLAAGRDRTTAVVTNSVAAQTAGAMVVDVMTQGNAGAFTPTQSGQSERFEASCATSSSATSTQPVTSPGTIAMGWQHSKPKRWAHALATFAPAP